MELLPFGCFTQLCKKYERLKHTWQDIEIFVMTMAVFNYIHHSLTYQARLVLALSIISTSANPAGRP